MTEKTMGNACAISNADFITRQLFERIDFQEMYMNALSSYSPGCAKIPMIAKDEGQAIGMAVRSVPGITMDTAKIVRIKDTAHLEELWVSDALSPQIERINGIAFCE